MRRLKQDGLIFTIGGAIYGIIELLWRRYTHWSMLLTGGLCFLLLFRIFTRKKGISMVKKCLIGSLVITLIEFFVGLVVNVWLKLNVWDYSNMNINLLGQICPLYSLLWGLLTIPISIFCKKMQRIVGQI